MADYSENVLPPWSHRNRVGSVTIESGVTSIGNYAFFEAEFLSSIKIPRSVTSIGDSAFEGCYTLHEIYIPGSVTHIGKNLFSNCHIIVHLPGYFKDRAECTKEYLGLSEDSVIIFGGMWNDNPTKNPDDEDITNKDKAADETNTSSSDFTGASDETTVGVIDSSDESIGSSYFSKTADTVVPYTLFALVSLMMVAFAGVWVSLKKQRS